MSLCWPKVRIKVDDIVAIDGEEFDILGRVGGPDSDDTFVVEDEDGNEHEWHVDEFSERAAGADKITVTRWESRDK